MSSLRDVIATVVTTLPEQQCELLAKHVSGLLVPTTLDRQKAEDLVGLPDFRAACQRVWAAWAMTPEITGAGVALAIRAASDAARSERTAVNVAAVVTGPSSFVVPVRQTSAVLLELLGRAEHSLLLTSFSAYKVPTVMSALKAAVERGVHVRMLLETADGGALDFDIADEFAAIAGLEVLVWPANMRPPADAGKASMHAKVVVCDREAAFVTSANLTGTALERNLEVGVLVDGGALAGKLWDHFDQLKVKGILNPLPV